MKKLAVITGMTMLAALTFAGCGKSRVEKELESAVQEVFAEIDKEIEQEVGEYDDEQSGEQAAEETADYETITIDPFDPAVFGAEGGITVEYEGIAPEGVPFVNYGEHLGGGFQNEVYREDPYKAVFYQIEGVAPGSYGSETAHVEDGSSFTEGSELTITASLRDDAMDAGIELASTQTKVTLSGIPHRLRDVAELEPYLGDIAELVSELFAKEEAGSVELSDGEGLYGGLENAHAKKLGAVHLEIHASGEPSTRFFVSCYDSLDGMEGWDTAGQTYDNLISFYEFSGVAIGADGKLYADCMWHTDDGWEIRGGVEAFPFFDGRFLADDADFVDRMLRQHGYVEPEDSFEILPLPGGELTLSVPENSGGAADDAQAGETADGESADAY